MTSPSDLDRFLPPQAQTHATALAELRAGRKVTHWIWWEMPQLRSLGRSQRALDYGLTGIEDARAYLAHPGLGPRLEALCRAVLRHADKSAEEIMGPVDALKLRSMATLFAAAQDGPGIFQEILDQFFDGEGCLPTLTELGRPTCETS